MSDEWAATGSALKAALVAGDFDNRRTPEQYRISHQNSHAVVFASDRRPSSSATAGS